MTPYRPPDTPDMSTSVSASRRAVEVLPAPPVPPAPATELRLFTKPNGAAQVRVQQGTVYEKHLTEKALSQKNFDPFPVQKEYPSRRLGCLLASASAHSRSMRCDSSKALLHWHLSRSHIVGSFFSYKALKQKDKLPINMVDMLYLLRKDLARRGPAVPSWPHYGKIVGSRSGHHHCHLNKGHPTYVVVWQILDNVVRILEIQFVGTHGKVDYSRFK